MLAVNLVNAWSQVKPRITEEVLAQKAVDNRFHELAVIPDLIPMFEQEGFLFALETGTSKRRVARGDRATDPRLGGQICTGGGRNLKSSVCAAKAELAL